MKLVLKKSLSLLLCLVLVSSMFFTAYATDEGDLGEEPGSDGNGVVTVDPNDADNGEPEVPGEVGLETGENRDADEGKELSQAAAGVMRLDEPSAYDFSVKYMINDEVWYVWYGNSIDGEEVVHTLMSAEELKAVAGNKMPRGQALLAWRDESGNLVQREVYFDKEAKFMDDHVVVKAELYDLFELSVTYDAGAHGTGTMEPELYYEGETVQVPKYAPAFTVDEGYRFVGFALELQDPKLWKVTYDANDGTGSFVDEDVQGQYRVRTANATGISKEGYAFTHWNTKADDSGTKYYGNDTFELTGDTTLYARWAEHNRLATKELTQLEMVPIAGLFNLGEGNLMQADLEMAGEVSGPATAALAQLLSATYAHPEDNIAGAKESFEIHYNFKLVAQYEKIEGNGGNEGGNQGGGGDPWEPETRIPEPEVPLAEEPVADIEEEDVPLAELPTTGGNSRQYQAAAVTTAAMMGVLAMTWHTKERDETEN